MFWLLRLASVAAFLGFWQWYGSQPTQYAVAPPSEVLPELVEGITNGVLPEAMLGTLEFMIVGLAIAAVLGIAIGLLIAASEVADNTLTPLVNSAYAAPITLLIPIIGVYTGIDFWGKVFLVVAFAIFVILINTEAGVRSVSAARSAGQSSPTCCSRSGTSARCSSAPARPSTSRSYWPESSSRRSWATR